MMHLKTKDVELFGADDDADVSISFIWCGSGNGGGVGCDSVNVYYSLCVPYVYVHTCEMDVVVKVKMWGLFYRGEKGGGFDVTVTYLCWFFFFVTKFKAVFFKIYFPKFLLLLFCVILLLLLL